MKKIALVGLNNFNNMGDRIIAETAQYLTEKSGKIESYFVDISPYDSYCKVNLPIRFTLFNIIRKFKGITSKFIKSNFISYHFENLSWRVKLYRYYKSKLKKADAIIFSGGGFIKYQTQELNYLVDMVTKIAENKGIPVMMNAMGVEGYDEKDRRCQKLKESINRPCVKVITTRDDLALLEEKYIENKSITTALVGDPAYFIPECYEVKKEESHIVGIGVIRNDIFLRYGIDYNENEVMRLYQEIINELENRNINWRIFSNGLSSDYQFGIDLLESLKISKDYYMPLPKSAKEYVDMITGFDSIIGARLHACITAYSLDIPAIGLIWNEKLRLFGELINKKDNYISVDELNGRVIVDTLEQKQNDYYNKSQRVQLKALTERYIKLFINKHLLGR